MLSQSNGRNPQSNAYRSTPKLHTSTLPPKICKVITNKELRINILLKLIFYQNITNILVSFYEFWSSISRGSTRGL